MPAIHHATAKKAANLGLEIIAQPDSTFVVAIINGGALATGNTAKEALDAAVAVLDDNTPDRDEPEDDAREDGDMATEGENGAGLPDVVEAEGDEEEATGEEPAERSIVKRKYRKRYQPTARTCGDELAKLISAHIRDDDVINEDRLVRFAKANDCWIDSYATLNVGQQRMNVGNRLRAKVRKGHEVVWAM